MIEPRPEFLDELEAKLRARHRALQPRRVVRWRAAAAVLILLFAASLLIPSVRSFAQGTVEDLFERAESDTLPAGELSISNDTRNFDPEDDARTTVQMRVPARIPTGFELDSVTVSPDGTAVTQQYKRPGRFLIISQTTQEVPVNYDLIGASAEIVPVTINGIEGAYVEGVWGARNPGDDFRWMPDASFRRLRWVDGDVSYEIFSMGGSPGHAGYLSMEDMIELAESLE